MARRKLFIHMGPHKTGTTTIQQGLVSHKAILEQLGYHFPDVCFNYNGHHNLVKDLLGSSEYKDWLGGLDALLAYAKATDGHLILSSEDFARLVESEPLRKLRDAFSEIFEIHLIGYLRPQEELLQSFWKTEVLFLNLLDEFQNWLDKGLVEWPYLKYDEWLSVLHDIFEPDNIHFNIYDPEIDDLFLSFLELCGLEDHSQINSPKRENVSVPSVSFEILRHLYINPFIRSNAKANKSVPVMMIGVRNKARLIREFANSEAIDLSYSAYSAELLETVRTKFKEHNRRAAKTYFNRNELFSNSSKLRPLPVPATELLTTDQALRLGGKFIEFEQNKSRNPKDKNTFRQRPEGQRIKKAPD